MQNIIELDEKGENYRILWGLVNGGRPTSELPSHLMNHEVKKGVTNVYHAHTTNVIALTFVLPLEDKVFTREQLLELTIEEHYEKIDRVIDAHVKNLRQKIELDTKKATIIKTVYGVGYKFGL